MRSSKWLSNFLLASRASFCSCNFATKPLGVPKSSNKLTYKKPNRPQSKLSSRKVNKVSKVRESDKTKNAKLPKAKLDVQSDKFSPGGQLSTRDNSKPMRIKKFHDFKDIVKPYNSKKNTQELWTKIVNSQSINEPATKPFLMGSLKSPESGPKDSLKRTFTGRGLKSIDGILKEANDIRYKLNAKREETNGAKTAVGIYQNMLKYDKKIDTHVIDTLANQSKVDDVIVTSMTYATPTPDKSSIKNYQPKNTGGPSKNVHLTFQMKYGKNKPEEVSTKMENPYYIFQPTASPKIKDAKLKMWSPFDQPTAVNQPRFKTGPIQIKVLSERKEGNLFNNLDNMIGENIKTFPKKVLKYNLKAEESEVHDENKDSGEVINNKMINARDLLLENNETKRTKDKLFEVVVNPKYLEDVKNKFFTNKERVVMVAPSKNLSKSIKQRDMTHEIERKIEQKNQVKVIPEKNALVEMWKTSRMVLPGSTKKKIFIKPRRIKPATPSSASQLLKQPDRSPKKISYAKKLNDSTNANSIIKIPMTTTPVEDYNSETMPIPWVGEEYVNPFNNFKMKIHKQLNDNYKWSPYTKNRNRKSKYPDRSPGDVIHIDSAKYSAQENKNELDSSCEDDTASLSDLSTDLKANENRVWVSDVYKKKTSLVVDPLLSRRKRNTPPTKRKRPLFVVRKPSVKILAKPTKTKLINNNTMFMEKKPKKDGSKYPNIRDYRNNGDKCPLATKSPKKVKTIDTFLNMENAESKVVTVKVLNCPDMEKGSSNGVQRDQEWSILPTEMEDKWNAYQKSKSQSYLTNSDQTKTGETSKPATMAKPNVVDKHSAEAQFFNVLLSRSLGNSGVIDLAQTPNPEPTVVKLITDNYLNERGLKVPVSRPIYSHRLKEENHLDLRKLFSRDKQTPSSDVQSTEPEAEDLSEPHQQLEDYQPDSDEAAEDTEEYPRYDETYDDTSNASDACESCQNKSIQEVVQDVTPETTNTHVDNQPEQSEEYRWTQQMEMPKMHQRPFIKPITSTFPIPNMCRTPRSSSTKEVVVLNPNGIPVDIKNNSYAVTTRKNKLSPSKIIF